MANKGRPITRPTRLKDGFYLEVGSAGSKVKLRKDNMDQIEMAIRQFEKIKETTFLGELKGGVWLSGKNKGKKLAE